MKLLPAEAVTDADGVLRNPVIPELEEVIHPVHVDRGADENVGRHIKPRRHGTMQLEVAGTFGTERDRGASNKLIAGLLAGAEADSHAAESGLHFRHEALGLNGLPNAVEIVENRAVIQPGIIALAGAPRDLCSRSEVRREYQSAARIQKKTGQFRGI